MEVSVIEKKRILLIDSDCDVLEILKIFLESKGYCVYCSTNGNEIISQIEKINPHLLFVDQMNESESGIELCSKVRNVSKMPIILMSSKNDENTILSAFEAGVDDYITKPFSIKVLGARTRALLLRSQADLGGNIYNFEDEALLVDENNHEVKMDKKHINLTPNEFKLLLTLLKYPKKAFTREELVCLTFGDDYEGYDRTVDTHIKNLRRKIETDPRQPKYIKTIYGIGYKFGLER